MTFDQAASKWIRTWEGEIPHLYLDNRGFVTVGVGFLVPSSKACKDLPLVDRLSHEPASQLEKANEYARVLRQPIGHPAAWYSSITHLILSANELQRLLDLKIASFVEGINKLPVNQDGLPDSARLALLDMAYNLGLGGLAKFHRLILAVKNREWEEAAVESHRSTCRSERNEAVASLFRSCLVP